MSPEELKITVQTELKTTAQTGCVKGRAQSSARWPGPPASIDGVPFGEGKAPAEPKDTVARDME